MRSTPCFGHPPRCLSNVRLTNDRSRGPGGTQRKAAGSRWGISRAGPAPACLAAALARRSTTEKRRQTHAPQAELEQAAQLVQQVAAGAIVAAATRKLNL